ncbi:Beta-galactosidase trimerization domain protein [Planctomycetes bacterium CA13]|uniref:Beta-galactosidase trimerization domain protein n=1 Tax=Novipirellula herctigrandis TaxID=2527986 RepID=A0A5C5Z327_9BACT|nr:Beta-galactosidase trimerization domain protein [Planctomycetes bacterium CA13]
MQSGQQTTNLALILGTILIGMSPIQGQQKIGTRQIHLDFHTSEHLPEIGADFSKEQFQEALKVANVNAINIFAKGHHSWSYYPTKVGHVHPNLDFDLLGAQIEACHEIGVLCPFYFTFGWSHTDATRHPEWCARNQDGTMITTSSYNFDAKPDTPKPNFQWINMCCNTPYHDHMMKQVEELCEMYPVDGFWFDIYQINRLCYCETCKKRMKEQGFNVGNKQDVQRFQGESFKKHQRELSKLIRNRHPEATIYFNGVTSTSRGAANFTLKLYENNTVQDLEDLPTTWGGYDKLPIQSKYFLKAGYPVTAMSGKFHKAWGEFGGFKHPNALKYEAASMISWGANCNFGDQLHPNGLMDMDTYKNIGVAYEYVEKIEDFGVGGLPTARVGVWRSFDSDHDEGVTQMLLESHVNFNVANVGNEDLTDFDVIVVPGVPCLNEADAARLNEYAKAGGALLVIGEGAMDRSRQTLLLDIGAEFVGSGTYDRDYLVVGDSIEDGLVNSPFLCYTPGLRIKPASGTEVLASIREPYFSRTYEKFTSHQNTPYKLEDAPHPGVIRNGNVIFFAHELDRMYFIHGARLHRDLFANALKLVHKRPMVETKLPSAGRVSLLHQAEQKRYVAHLLYGPPITRGQCEVIEDLPTLHDVPLTVNLPVDVKKAVLVPAMKELPITKKDGKLTVTIPQFSCHCAVAFEYE